MIMFKPREEMKAFATDEEIVAGTKGVMPTNMKSNELAVRNLQAWMDCHNSHFPDDPVPTGLQSYQDPAVLCKWLCCFVQETRKENGGYPPSTLRHLRVAFQRILSENKSIYSINKISTFVTYTILWTVCA